MYACRTDLRAAVARYSFADDGGALGDVTLDLDEAIPEGCHVTHGHVEVVTALASSGSAVLTLSAVVDGDVQAPTAFGALTGRTALAPVDLGIDAVRSRSELASLRLTIAGAALTAGVFDVVLYHVRTPRFP